MSDVENLDFFLHFYVLRALINAENTQKKILWLISSDTNESVLLMFKWKVTVYCCTKQYGLIMK